MSFQKTHEIECAPSDNQCTVNTFGSKIGILTLKMKMPKFDFLQLFSLKYIM